jgi:hypothetical protein
MNNINNNNNRIRYSVTRKWVLAQEYININNHNHNNNHNRIRYPVTRKWVLALELIHAQQVGKCGTLLCVCVCAGAGGGIHK